MSEKEQKDFCISQTELFIGDAVHWAIRANLDESIVSELKHLKNVVAANKTKANEKP